MAGQETVIPSYAIPQPGISAGIPAEPYRAGPGVSLGGGTGGFVDRNKIINDSVQNAINQTHQLQQMQRDKKQYDTDQAARKGSAGAANPDGSGAPTDHPGFMDNVMHGLSSLGAGVKSIFGGPSGIPAGDPNAGANAGPTAPAGAAGPLAAAATEGPPPPAAMMDGGVVRARANEGLIGMDPPPSPSVLPYQNGGVIQGYENGGQIDTTGIVNAGTQNAIDQSQQLQGMQRDASMYSHDQDQRGAVADASMPPSVAQEHLAKEVDSLHSDMHMHALGDDDAPNHSRGVPSPDAGPRMSAASQQVSPDADAPSPAAAPPAPDAQGAAAPAPPQGPAPAAQGAQGVPTPPDPAKASAVAAIQAVANAPPDDPAKTGQQVTSPSAEDKPHSITPEVWNRWDDKINNAVKLAALAGHDPGQVRQALEANRNAYIQGHVLRYLSSANVALQANDTKGVEAAMKNAYYYMPDGQNLKIQKDPQTGQMLYQDPINPTKLDANNKSQPNLIPVDAAHLKLLGQAMLDPMQVNQTLMEVRNAARLSQDSAAKRELERQQGIAALATGAGNLAKGKGIYKTGLSHEARVSAQNYKDLSEGDAALIRAKALDFKLRNTIRTNHIDPQLLKGAQDASDGFEKAVQGQLSTGAGANDPSTLNPAAGKTYRDPDKSILPGAKPEDVTYGKAVAGQIMLGANGTMAPGRAIQLAVMATAARRSSSPKPDAKGKVTTSPDFVTDPKTGDTHVWNKAQRRWEAFKLPLTSANAAASGNLGVTDSDLDDATKAELASNGGVSGSGAIPSNQAAAGESDMKDQEFPADEPS